MNINTTLKILMCLSALVFAGVGTASAHQHKAGEAAAVQMKDKTNDKAKDLMNNESQTMERGEVPTMEEKPQI